MAPRPPGKRWRVEGEATSVAAVVARLGGDPRAVAEGRVFVGRRRALRGDEPVPLGEEVFLADAVASPVPPVVILAQRGGMVAVAKPAGLPTIPDHRGASHALLGRTAALVGVKESELHPTSRLDREVSGVVIFTLTEAARVRLARARDEHRYRRRYLALGWETGSGTLREGEAVVWDAPVGRAADPRHRRAFGKDAAPARTHGVLVAKAGNARLLALAPVTGRTHQLRVHASHAGVPLVGDGTYGGPTRVTTPRGASLSLTRVALHALRVEVPDERGDPLVLEMPVPEVLTSLWRDLGGESAAWDRAASWSLRDD